MFLLVFTLNLKSFSQNFVVNDALYTQKIGSALCFIVRISKANLRFKHHTHIAMNSAKAHIHEQFHDFNVLKHSLEFITQ